MTFHNPLILLLLILIVPIVLWYVKRHAIKEQSVRMSSIGSYKGGNKSWRVRLRHIPFVLRMMAFALVVIVLARPQSSNSWQNRTKEGIDIIMTMDISGTMLAEDLKPNRLKAAKNVAIDFIKNRPNDNIGLVLFAGESFAQCPLTNDHNVLINMFNSVDYGMLADGTAIGLGLANAVGRLKDSKAKSKVVILLTDGSNNAGDISPETAADIAAKMGVRVYSIGVGTRGKAPFPIDTPFGIQYQEIDVDIDEPMLKRIAQKTDGKYFRATDNKKLKEIYDEIDKMEKTKIEVQDFSRKNEAYLPFALLALLCIFSEIVLRKTLFDRIP